LVVGFSHRFPCRFACKFSGLILHQTRQNCTCISDFFSNLLSEAEKINQVQFIRGDYLPNEKDFSKYCDPETNLTHILWTLFSDNPPSQLDGFEVPTIPADRAEKALQVMTVIVHRYPFPEEIRLVPGGIEQFPPKPLVFKDTAQIDKWSKDLHKVHEMMSMWPVVEKKTVYEYLQALQDKKKEVIDKWNTDPLSSFQGEVDPYRVYNNYIQNINRTYEINRSVKFYLDKIESSRSLFVPKKQILIIMGLTFFAFFCGVILPLFIDRVYRIVLLIPCILYISAFCFLVYKMFV